MKKFKLSLPAALVASVFVLSGCNNGETAQTTTQNSAQGDVKKQLTAQDAITFLNNTEKN